MHPQGYTTKQDICRDALEIKVDQRKAVPPQSAPCFVLFFLSPANPSNETIRQVWKWLNRCFCTLSFYWTLSPSSPLLSKGNVFRLEKSHTQTSLPHSKRAQTGQANQISAKKSLLSAAARNFPAAAGGVGWGGVVGCIFFV